MVTGKERNARDNSVATLYAHVHEPPPPVTDALAQRNPAFGGVIEKAMAKDPADRYASAGDLARDVEAALQGVRYTGPATVVATGEAALTESREAPAEPAAPAPEPTAPAPEPASTGPEPPRP